MAARLLKISVVYLFFGALLGMAMGMRQDFSLTPVHAHLGLLGWATLALAGLIYHHYPAAATTRLAKLHFWLHNIGLPIFMGSLALIMIGYHDLFPGAAIGGLLVVVGLACFMVNVFLNVRQSA